MICILLVFIQVLTKRHTVHKHVIVVSLASKLVPGHRYNFWTICFISPSVLTVINYFLNKKHQASFCQNWNRALFCTSSTKNGSMIYTLIPGSFWQIKGDNGTSTTRQVWLGKKKCHKFTVVLLQQISNKISWLPVPQIL